MEDLDEFIELRKFLASQPFDQNLSNYKQDLYPSDKLSYDKGMGPYYNYILDWQTGSYDYLSEGLKTLTGYEDNFFNQGLEATLSIIHPADREAFQNIVSKWMGVLLDKPEQRFNAYSGNFNFRIKKKSGDYINLLQQPVYTTFDKKGNMVYEAGMVVDISRYRSDGNISLIILGPDGRKVVEYYPKEDFAPSIATVRNKITELEKLADQSGYLFLRDAQKVLAECALDETFNVSGFSEALNISRSQLYRDIKEATELSPSRLIRIFRLQQSLEFLAQNDLHILEVAYRVGFSSPAYFSKCFSEELKCTPSEYQKQVK